MGRVCSITDWTEPIREEEIVYQSRDIGRTSDYRYVSNYGENGVTCALCCTVKSFIELTKYLLGLDGVQFVFSEKLSQDPLESFFGKQRMRGGHCDNPSVQSFIYGTSSLRVQGSVSMNPLRGNCRRGRKRASIVVDNTPLPKRPRKKTNRPRKKRKKN